ncbi:hypothetical protein AKJ08_3221 [Vulgatibacter incomptus]|uniref:Uncharacterized protein n=1 Tax=Vulgatibacter incomptus TaxID=1391653 RepID=A0A0K1PI96_9BACT|nr:hypothetical protein AKJ08_3221 [Vulgatibacter incomptus]
MEESGRDQSKLWSGPYREGAGDGGFETETAAGSDGEQGPCAGAV